MRFTFFRVISVLFVALLLNAAAGVTEQETQTYTGKTLEQALRELQLKGLNVVYSSDLVRPEMKVTVEPAAGSPREVLKRLLQPYGLKAEDGPVNTLLVVYSSGSGPHNSETGETGAAAGRSSAFVLVPFVNISLIAQDPDSHYVTNLTADDFVVKENGKPQQIVDFSNHSFTEHAEQEPLTVLFLVDCSQSMSKVSLFGIRRLDLIKEAAIGLLDFFKPSDRFVAMGFSSKSWLIQDLTPDFEEIRNGITAQKTVFERTALYDAVMAALKTLQEPTGRKVIILCSDGEDNISKTTMKDVLLALGSSDVTLFSIASMPVDPFAKEGAGNLTKIAETSGGRSFFYSNSNEVKAIMVDAGEAIRSQYSIGYYPSDDRVHGWRRLEVECKVPGVRLRYRKNYLF